MLWVLTRATARAAWGSPQERDPAHAGEMPEWGRDRQRDNGWANCLGLHRIKGACNRRRAGVRRVQPGKFAAGGRAQPAAGWGSSSTAPVGASWRKQRGEGGWGHGQPIQGKAHSKIPAAGGNNTICFTSRSHVSSCGEERDGGVARVSRGKWEGRGRSGCPLPWVPC